MKTLYTARLRLRPRRLDDLEAILAMDADPEVRRHLGGPPEPTAHRAAIRVAIEAGASVDYRMWVIEERDRPGFLGQCGLRSCHLPNHIELTWRLPRVTWRQGFASEAAAAVMAHARHDLGHRVFAAFIEPANEASQRVTAKIGLHAAGETVMFGKRQLVWRCD